MNPAADSPTVRERFLTLYKADLLAGRVCSLAEYQARFKGHEESIADEWRWLEPETVEPQGLVRVTPDSGKRQRNREERRGRVGASWIPPPKSR